MTKQSFKAGLNSDLKYAGFTERVTKVDELDVNTTLLFDSAVSEKLGEWLNKRFSNGISLSPGTMANLVILLTPNQAKELRIKESKEEPNKMPKWDKNQFDSYLSWAEACYKAGYYAGKAEIKGGNS